MAIGRISGSMLVSNLDRQGTDLQFTTNNLPVFYMNVSQYRVGVNTNVATQTLTVNGNLSTSGLLFEGNAISAKNGGSVTMAGVANLGTVGNVKISGGTNGYLIFTDGAGNLSFGDPSVVVGQAINANVIALGTNATGSFSSALTFTTATKVTDAVASLNQLVGNITDAAGTVIHVTGNVTAGNVISNFYGNVVGNIAGYHTGDTTGNITGTTASFTNVTGTLLTANQPNITSVGTLAALSVTGNIAAGNVSASTLSGSLSGLILSASQPNITGVGILNNLVVAGNVQAGNVIATQFNGNTFGNHTGNATGTTASYTNFAGTLTTAAQPNITTVGTLISLATTGNVTASNVNASLHGNIVGQTALFTSNVTSTGFIAVGATADNRDAGAIGFVNDSYGFVTQFNDAVVIVNEQGATEQTLFLGDTGIGSTGTLLGVAVNNTPMLNFTGMGDLTVAGNVAGGTFNGITHGAVNTNSITGINGDLTITVPANQVAIISSSTAIKVPSGSDAARPVGVAGYTRFNTSSAVLEYYDGSAWVPITNKVTSQTFNGDGINDTYSLTRTTTQVGVLVSINGALQQPTSAYTIGITGDTITFAEIPLATDVIEIRYLGGVTSVSGTITGDLNVQGNVTLSGILQAPLTTKAANAPGTAGQVAWDANYFYVCTATNTWKRTLLTGGY
jgi:hypothetical protein